MWFFFAFFCIVLGTLPSVQSCQADWSNRCRLNQDCCSGNCFKGESNDWLDGLCKPGSGLVNSRGAFPLASGSYGGLFGGLGSQPGVFGGQNNCQADWTNRCRSNQDCCSGNCFKGDSNNWLDGLCKPGSGTGLVSAFGGYGEQSGGTGEYGGPTVGIGGFGSQSNCQAAWTNRCRSNQDCCSGYCFMGESNNWLEGLCKPGSVTVYSQGAVPLASGSYGGIFGGLGGQINCQADWTNRCRSNQDCCSGNCFKGWSNDWLDGLCKPGSGSGSVNSQSAFPPAAGGFGSQYVAFGSQSNCQVDWSNRCRSNQECCSGYCFKGESNDWLDGVCKP